MDRPKTRILAGVMSGTSVDGIDVALVRCQNRGRWKLLAFHHSGYRPSERQAILDACYGRMGLPSLARLHYDLGARFATAVLDTCRAARLRPVRLTAVAFHGQTVFHDGGRATLQLGEPGIVAERVGVPVISDFRAADIAAGGQGAPLVPWMDYRLFHHARRYRAVLNLGGISNLTLIPPGAPAEKVLGFDTGPGNMVIDELIFRMSNRRQLFDKNGQIAARGKVNTSLQSWLLRHPFLKRRPPKSAGREQFGGAFVDEVMRRARLVSPDDIVATATAFTAACVVRGLKWGGRSALHSELIVSGGGAANRTLLRLLSDAAPGCRLRLSDELGVPGNAKEAIAFALMGDAHLRHKCAHLPHTTGARHAAILGKLTPVHR